MEKESFFSKLFSCCIPEQDQTEGNTNLNLHTTERAKATPVQREEPEMTEKPEKKKEQPTNDFMETSVDPQLFPKKYIRPDEESTITFTKQGILSFIDILKGLSYEEILNKDGLVLSLRKEGSPLKSDVMLTHSTYSLPKKSFKKAPTLEQYVKCAFDVDERKKWDDSLQLLETLEKFDSGAMLIHGISKRQMMIISERENYEKRYSFIQDGVYYQFGSSVPDELYPITDQAVRVTLYLNILMIQEDEENFYFDAYGQVDIKMNMPVSLLKMAMPKRMKDMNGKIIKAVNEMLK